MAKSIVFVRHGKSSWDLEVGDKDRPLKERGIKDASLVVEEFLTKNIRIDKVYSSPANRALHTCLIFLRRMDFDLKRLEVTNELYDFSGEQVLKFLKNLDDTCTTVMVFGHNYAFTTLVNTFGSLAVDNVPTSGLVKIDFSIHHWKELEGGETKFTIFPKQLK